ncbi:Oidioi.mRNA.OKI2018_I69.chr2.g5174.t1.cds [Oikopleura dioica]|uniref:Oidioi.mRNA.OKI2018_I69.chr2.g5174.t1.cds n=1 Tax=Oikopleura dioica TaxID=34765 RepID=A0ABN7T3B4_OIKDI|nr:Oidioi.mRNA.OKI2018_I69.chr2.g5174.t1.cds [Oikopleura dioica]
MKTFIWMLGAIGVSSFNLDPTPPNNYTTSTKGCPCFFDQKKTTECPCCVDENSCPCSWPYDDRCGDCNTGHGCLPEPINIDTLSDRGCTCQDDDIFGLEKGSCACCTPYSHSGKHICPCAYPYHHMCVECSEAQSCGNHIEAALYQELYPNYFKPVQASESLMLSDVRSDREIAPGSNICHEIPHKIENGFTICDKIPKKGKACVFFCDDGYQRVGNYRAECVCSELGCNWNDEPGYEMPYCVKDACADEPCQNGGTCKADEDGFTCDCKPGYLGTLCEVELMADFVGGLFGDDIMEEPMSSPTDAPEFRVVSPQTTTTAVREYDEEEEEEEEEDVQSTSVGRFARRKKFGKNKDRNTCPPLDGGENGGLRCTKGFKKSSTCHLVCDDGFTPSNTKFSKPRCICNSNRCSWDRSNSFKLAKCSAWPKPEGENVNDAIVNSDNSQRMFVQQTKCPPLTKPANGNVRCTEVNKDGSRCQFLCKSGFNVSKARFARCACVDGKCMWNKEEFYTEPLCEDKDECALGNHNCAADMHCVNKPGSFFAWNLIPKSSDDAIQILADELEFAR